MTIDTKNLRVLAEDCMNRDCESARVALAEVADRYTRVKRWGVDAKSLQDIPPIVDLYEELLRNATGGQMEQWLGGVREAKGRMAGAAL